MGFPKGYKSPGRPKGSLNSTSRQAQQEILDSLKRRDAASRKAGEGPYLDTLDDKLFTQLIGRVLPKDVTMDVQGRLTIEEILIQADAE